MTDFLVNECGIRRNFDTFLKLAARGKLLIILDGFDEMAKQVDVNIRRRNFREISRLMVGNSKVVLSGRPNYFVTQAEIDEIFSQAPPTEDPYKAAIKKATSNNTSRYEILGVTLFDRWQIEEFIKKQSEYLKAKGIDDWRELQKTIYDTYNLEELARTPVLLEIIIKTISEIRGKVSHVNAAKLYQIYTDFWLNREYDEKGDVRWLVTRKEKELFVLSLAWTMLLSDNMNPEIHFSKLSERVRSYFDLEKATEIEYFSSDIRFCSYLTHSETDGNYRFIHKSFMEYFSARRIYKALFEEQDVSGIVTDKPITDEVFFFLCQMIDSDEIDLLENLSRKENDKTNKEFIIGLTARVLQQGMNINEQRGVIKSAEKWVDKLLLYCEEFSFDRGKLWGLIGKGKLKAQLGQYAEAEIYYQKALNLSEQMNERLALSQSLIQLGIISQSRGDLDKSLQYYQKALVIFEEFDDRASIGQTLTNVGTVCQSRGELDKSLQYYQQALAIFEEIGDRAGVGQTLSNVAEIFQTRGEVDDSLQYSQQSLAIFREIGDRRGERKALSQLGYIYELTGRYDEAERISQESLAIAREIGDRQGASRVLSRLGSICTVINRYPDAERYYQEALAIAREINDQQGVGNALTSIGIIYHNMARYEDAASLYQESIVILESIGDIHAVGGSLYNLANVYSVQGLSQEALELYKKSLGIFEKIGDLRAIGTVVRQLGVISQNNEDFEQAENFYRKALETSEKMNDVRNAQSILESLGSLAEAQQNFTEAERLYKESLEISLKIGDKRGECELSVKLGKLARRNGNTQKTIEYYRRYVELAQKMKLSLLADVVQEYDQLRTERYNPFITAGPVRDEAFYGRTRELHDLYRHIQRQENVMLVGERRMGKSSLLFQLKQRLKLPFVAVLIDLQAFPGQAESLLNGVIQQTVDALLREGLLSSERWEKFSLTYARDFVKALESMVDEAKEKLKDIKIVLILDEAERLLHAESQAAGVLRATLQMNQHIVAVIAMSNEAAIQPEAGITSPLFNIFMRITLRPLTKDDTETLIREPSKHIGVSYEPAAISRIYELSGGVPYYAQALGAEIIDIVNEEKKNKVCLEDVDKLLPDLLERLSTSLHYTLHPLNEAEREVLSMIVNGESLKDVRKQSIRDLENKQMIVKENGGYRFVSKLFEAWFKQYGVA